MLWIISLLQSKGHKEADLAAIDIKFELDITRHRESSIQFLPLLIKRFNHMRAHHV